jgi:hypothetical protein
MKHHGTTRRVVVSGGGAAIAGALLDDNDMASTLGVSLDVVQRQTAPRDPSRPQLRHWILLRHCRCVYSRGMNEPLRPSDELHCPHCRQWHLVALLHTEGTEFTRRMVYWKCRGGQYYAGLLDATSRHDTRRPLALLGASVLTI